MKTCTHCHKEKTEEEFYASKNSASGLQAWCIDCVKQLSRAQGKKGSESFRYPVAESTALVRTILAEHGIPSCAGTAMGQNKVDLMAWACVPIEAKLARESGANQFVWKFTPGQLDKLEGLVIFVADYGKQQRYFVMPVSAIKEFPKHQAERIAGFSLTIGSEHGNSQWQSFKDYEDRFDLIEVERQKFENQNNSFLPTEDPDATDNELD